MILRGGGRRTSEEIGPTKDNLVTRLGLARVVLVLLFYFFANPLQTTGSLVDHKNGAPNTFVFYLNLFLFIFNPSKNWIKYSLLARFFINTSPMSG